MKRITKRRRPAALTKWLRLQNGHNCSYDPDMPSDVRSAILGHLLKEQGWICCYTGLPIRETKAHIEHVYPQQLCRLEGGARTLWGAKRDVDHMNMLAAHPEPGRSCQFGAVYRGNWWDDDLFVHPLRPDCEVRFRYNLNGTVEPVDDDPEGPAGQTITRLNLKDSFLVAQRDAAIDEFLFDDKEPLSPAQLARLEGSIMQRGHDGKHVPFCFVLHQACLELMRRARQQHTRRVAIRREQPRT
jgi:uncharacterized protein (TIGR02646 family)